MRELIKHLLGDDLAELEQYARRHQLELGRQKGGQTLEINAYNTSLFVTGPSGSGKSTMALSLLEQLLQQQYQFCLIDPEGDYETFHEAIMFGGPQREPEIHEIVQALETTERSVIVNLLGCALDDRPAFFQKLLPALEDLRTRLGHPHWLIIDEVHHLFPPNWDSSTLERLRDLFNLLLISAHPDQAARPVLALPEIVVSVGPKAADTLRTYFKTLGKKAPARLPQELERKEALVWFRKQDQMPLRIQVRAPEIEHSRHRRKYAEGDLGQGISFYFRGPQDKLKLRAQNLSTFKQLAEGIDEETWLFHLRQGDYSRWFHEVIKDDDLAKEAEALEQQKQFSAEESRARMIDMLKERYSL